jgi:hypothetical protein
MAPNKDYPNKLSLGIGELQLDPRYTDWGAARMTSHRGTSDRFALPKPQLRYETNKPRLQTENLKLDDELIRSINPYSNTFLNQSNSVASRQENSIKPTRPSGGLVYFAGPLSLQEAAPVLNKFDQRLKSYQEPSKIKNYPEAQKAVKLLKEYRKQGKVTVWSMNRPAAYEAGPDEIRINSNNTPDVPAPELHEGFHALDAKAYPKLAKAYSRHFSKGDPITDRSEYIRMQKWKAWTEYRAYYRVNRYEGHSPELSDQEARHTKAVQAPMTILRELGVKQFDPADKTPQ